LRGAKFKNLHQAKPPIRFHWLPKEPSCWDAAIAFVIGVQSQEGQSIGPTGVCGFGSSDALTPMKLDHLIRLQMMPFEGGMI
jgi:hypothetical protein